MNQTRWNCYHDPCCQKGAADCWKCDMFRQKMEVVDQVYRYSSGQPEWGYQEPDPDLPMTEVAWLEQRLDELKGEINFTRAKLQQHLANTARRKKQVGAY